MRTPLGEHTGHPQGEKSGLVGRPLENVQLTFPFPSFLITPAKLKQSQPMSNQSPQKFPNGDLSSVSPIPHIISLTPKTFVAFQL